MATPQYLTTIYTTAKGSRNATVAYVVYRGEMRYKTSLNINGKLTSAWWFDDQYEAMAQADHTVETPLSWEIETRESVSAC